MKKGLVLEGGAMRGMFTAGVIDVMMESGIDFDGVIGVSAGAAFGCNYEQHFLSLHCKTDTEVYRSGRLSYIMRSFA